MGSNSCQGRPACMHGGEGGAVVKGVVLATEGWAALKGGGVHSVQRRLGGSELLTHAFYLRQAVQRI